ncbi:MAG: HORMA domain containing protein, partial [Thermoanaerobaculales bacterium]
MSTVAVRSYTRTHTSVFVSDKLRNFLKLLVRHYGLNPQRVVDAWSDWVDRAARTWLESGHLKAVVIEFYLPGSAVAAARWDFPIRYDGNGVDEMWIDRQFFEDSFAKAKPPPAGCSYRIVLITDPNRPDVPGVGPTSLRSVNGMAARDS